ncbi:50S ribosomal protein L9 [Piscirickettsia salmonis]|uniref:50S ribosomal protein L9 n=1 Tax=Piscirickettsia salmonis TaxID=1238 RepID=UPI0012B6C940|nr:50S ribosomal protein L9 [Piscirickettsia salmonis]QGP49860.1 50S ribosomal protein L9 [Piscirickettsia salmonis]QGP55087.1 50S ribosomal protein L9 [Piscirickettsia salmonis]QGP59047.1 50S ribosomal protein L9 [Piscirickettsia salmonis]QGP64655.1 50S ribosomal protein L9 [Piscirickettsia salmonis]
MQIILKEKVRNLGDLGEQVVVKSGYARNFLIPTGKAVPATAANLKEFEARRAEIERLAQEKLAEAQKCAATVTELAVITVAAKAGDEGKLFGSIGTADIAVALAEKGIEISRQDIRLSESSIRQIGEYDVELHLHSDVEVTVKVDVVAAS